MLHSTALYRPETGAERLYRLAEECEEAIRQGRTTFYVGHGRTLRGARQMRAAVAAWRAEVES